MPEDMADMRECFLTGTAAEVTPVSRIGDYHFAPSDISRSLVDGYEKWFVRREETKSAKAGERAFHFYPPVTGGRRPLHHYCYWCGEVAIDTIDGDTHRVEICQSCTMTGRLFGDMWD